MKVLLDTHVLVWWLAGSVALSERQREVLQRIDEDNSRCSISAITLWEIAKLCERGRLKLHKSVDQFFADLERVSRIDVIPLSPRIALESTRLGTSFPKDPADQLIAATAKVHNLRLLTADRRIRESGVVAVL